jgi:hypothetical protein
MFVNMGILRSATGTATSDHGLGTALWKSGKQESKKNDYQHKYLFFPAFLPS